ncbi:helix-turn-helix transcriptional regulator [Rhodomicrobium lacus]|uniref:helix-turn-helix transcriptional regulator n=1 Tax=Rhodomicrobium lacus TaxID=2498452 RepID=UPI001FDFCCC9|nr:hypothetical protein [Rhodomicrobium lacus]
MTFRTRTQDVVRHALSDPYLLRITRYLPCFAQSVNPTLGETAVQREPRKSLPSPLTLQPRLVGREAAAAFIGLSVRKFDELVADGRMPKPKRIDARVLWDVRALDAAVDRLNGDVSRAVDGARA